MTHQDIDRLIVLTVKMVSQDSLPGEEYWEWIELQQQWEAAKQCDTERPREPKAAPLLPPE